MPKNRAPTRADLVRKVAELEAQLASTLHFADVKLASLREGSGMGSAVIVRLHWLGGAEITPPFAVRDGLSPETVAALRRDIVHSYEVATLFKPAGVHKP